MIKGPLDSLEEPKTKEEKERAFEHLFNAMFSGEVKKTMSPILRKIIEDNDIPFKYFKKLARSAKDTGSTRFEQIFNVVMEATFPSYHRLIVAYIVGNDSGHDAELRLWRCIFPPNFGLTHVIIRAYSFQEAFALAADYACRLSLKMYQKIPSDLTVRIQYMSETSVRHTVKKSDVTRTRRKTEFDWSRDIQGSLLAAMGHVKQKNYSIFRNVEYQDLKDIKDNHNTFRISSVELEKFSNDLPEDLVYQKYREAEQKQKKHEESIKHALGMTGRKKIKPRKDRTPEEEKERLMKLIFKDK